jgi:hypothetical protein
MDVGVVIIGSGTGVSAYAMNGEALDGASPT